MTVGASVTLNLYPEGSDTGDYFATMTALITGVGVSVDMGDIIERSISFQASGGVTWGTV